MIEVVLVGYLFCREMLLLIQDMQREGPGFYALKLFYGNSPGSSSTLLLRSLVCIPHSSSQCLVSHAGLSVNERQMPVIQLKY